MFVGDRGFPGQKGDAGPATNLDGVRIKGEKGDTGEKGRPGIDGLNGVKGDKGFPGRYSQIQSAV